jgi:hypothetical protein
MSKTILASTMAVFCFFGSLDSASAACKGRFNLEFGHTITTDLTMQRNTECPVNMAFDYVAFYGLSVRQAPKNGSIRLHERGFVYLPRKGFHGTDQFIVDAEGAETNWQTGTTAPRSKAGMLIKISVN